MLLTGEWMKYCTSIVKRDMLLDGWWFVVEMSNHRSLIFKVHTLLAGVSSYINLACYMFINLAS